MKIMVLGSGAREHALAWSLSTSRAVERVFAGPGNAGTGAVAENLPGVDPLKFDSVLEAVKSRHIDCVFVGPEAPLACGVVDFLSGHGVAAIGPGRDAAQLEASKAFSKAFMVRHGIPTARAVEIRDVAALRSILEQSAGKRLVLKKSGLAAGKGVLESSDPADMLSFGTAALQGDCLLVEEFLEGWEVSIFGVSDGDGYMVLPPCTDFKKAHDGDKGPNTGGMGAVCPVPWVDGGLMERITREIVSPTYAAAAREGIAYAGVLYFGLMITRSGPMVLEFNVRFGDPETQVLLPVMGLDLGELVTAMATRTLPARYGARAGTAGGPLPQASAPGAPAIPTGISAAPGAPAIPGGIGLSPRGGASVVPGPAALGVVIASEGYPERTAQPRPVGRLDHPPEGEALIFHAATGRDASGRTLAGSGRCFTAVGLGAGLEQASARAYAAARGVSFPGGWFRTDIGRKFLGGAQ